MRAPILALAAIALLAAYQAEADDASRRPTAEQIIQGLKSPVKTRAFNARGITVENNAVQPAPVNPSIDLEVNFEFGSARLTTDAELVLDNLGKALNDPALVRSRFIVAGHTDAVGGDAVNQTLSEQRAKAVKAYLVARHRIGAERLDTIGYGRSRLANPADPTSGVNRRVQVTNAGE